MTTPLRVEKEIKALASEGFEIVCLRLSTVYGWSPNMRFDLAINNLVLSSVMQGQLIVKDDPNLCRPFIHIDDVVKGIIYFCYASVEHFSVMNFGKNSENYRLSSIIELIAGLDSKKT